jgi:hypothetical protein
MLRLALAMLACVTGVVSAQSPWRMYASVGWFDGQARTAAGKFALGPGFPLELSVERSLTRELSLDLAALLLENVSGGSLVCQAGSTHYAEDAHSGGILARGHYAVAGQPGKLRMSLTGGGGFFRVVKTMSCADTPWILGDGPAVTAGLDIGLPGFWRTSPSVGAHAIRIVGLHGSHVDLIRAELALRTRLTR